MFVRYFLGFLFIWCCTIGCNNENINSKPKNNATHNNKKDEPKDFYSLYCSQGDACRYTDFFWYKRVATSIRNMACNCYFFEDTLANGDFLYGQLYKTFFFIKSKKTDKMYPIFSYSIFSGPKESILSDMKLFRNEPKETQERIKNIFYTNSRQMHFYPRSILDYLSLQAINDTLPRGTIKKFFDEVFGSINFYKNEEHRLSKNTLVNINHDFSYNLQAFPFKEDTNQVSLKKFLKTPGAKMLPRYEDIAMFIKYKTEQNDYQNLLCYELYKNMYLIIVQGINIHFIYMEVYGDYVPY